MRITFLGTAAANAYPEAFCSCQNCQEARILGGKSLRKRSAALINDDLLLDLGPDIMVASQFHTIPLFNVRYCLQTHPHADHLDLSHLLSRSPDFGVIGAPQLHFYASPATLERASQTFGRDLSDYDLFDPLAEQELNLKLHSLEPFQPMVVGSYRVTAFPANHAAGFGALLYALEADGRSIFYGTDTAPLFEETWQAFRQHRMRFDLVILDHTYGPNQQGSDHLSAHQVVEHLKRLRADKVLKDTGRVFATHIAHEGNPTHPKLAAFAARHGYEVAYDGLKLIA
ncbi:MAG: MBL fold metallo-hydrolase [Candidatus Promineifilaceae bacterium]|nr:MBL fold metallo-hydrolase [Candidatus Promineifilaceae bacterium]